MPVFSFTAPHITSEEERQERESLSESKRQELLDDLYGVETSIDETPELIETKLRELEEEMDALDIQRKTDYLDAKARAPHLVDTEASPLKFLRCEKFNAKTAACRMVGYWKMRRKLFGEERAFLPLTLKGALAEESELIENGIFAILPKDQKGRGVLFFDRIRATPTLAHRDAILRAFFYIIHVMSEEVSVQKHGYVVMKNIKGYDLYKHFDRLLTKQSSVMKIECMPIKMKAEHLLAGSANGVMSLVLPVMKHVGGKELRLRIVVHSGTDSKILESIKPYGLNSKNVSHALGGDFKHADFLTWLEDWKQQEDLRNHPGGGGTAIVATTELPS